MAGYQMNNFYRPSPLTIDTQAQKYFEEDDSSILDDNILDPGLEMSPAMDGGRRDSYAIFSPKPETDWHHVDMQPTPSNNPFADHTNNPFLRSDSSHTMTFGQQSQSWLGNHSGACTPMPAYDGLPAEFEGSAPASYRPLQGQTPFNGTGNQVSLFSPPNPSSASIPTSPHKDWMADGLEHRAMSKRMRAHSPGLRAHSPLMRRDGIRKKNARFDIPAERNLLNIDQLISQSTDEQEIKELKQQKRLLRNRQAALDSRQRKKQHTERLEDEKKQYTALLSELEEELAEAKIVLDEWARKEQQYQQYIETLQMEKEEMVRAHTLETGDLRKKVSVLTEHVQKIESTAMSTVPSSTGFTADYSDIDSLTMDSAWEGISFLNDFPGESEVKPEVSLVPAKKPEAAPALSEQDKPVAQGLLMMILLIGAFVASKGPTPSLPRMSDDVRAASATLLEDVFMDAGVPHVTTHTASGVVEAVAPLPSGESWSGTAPGQLHSTEMVGYGPSSLGDYADSLAQPTEEQKHEQLFSLTAAQYNGVTSQDFLQRPPVQSTSQGRRNLAETLAAMRSSTKQSAADVYTRSVLWDQVPRDVVRNFAKMVSESNTANRQDVCEDSVG